MAQAGAVARDIGRYGEIRGDMGSSRGRHGASRRGGTRYGEIRGDKGRYGELEGETWREQARWHGEMYGYVFAAAEVGVTHRIRRDIMLYPGYEPHLGRPPFIMHYGADYTLGRAYFNKMNYQQLRLEECSRHLLDTS